MRIRVEDVRHVALLARLELTADEERLFVAQLDGILRHVEKLGELSTDDVPPTAQPFDSGAVFRDDVVENGPAPEPLLAGAPDRSGNLFRVPKIIE
jgi:aspartyl-tRNA(Asn)/glutamyl-tRNA(Gln) amidotransferase subunit C